MVDLKATNLKLVQRAKNILREIAGPACSLSDDELDHVLQSCEGNVKLAAVAVALNVSVPEAGLRLSRNDGVLAKVFREDKQNSPVDDSEFGELVLCVDAGGSSCKAVVMAKDGAMGRGNAGPCNV